MRDHLNLPTGEWARIYFQQRQEYLLHSEICVKAPPSTRLAIEGVTELAVSWLVSRDVHELVGGGFLGVK